MKRIIILSFILILNSCTYNVNVVRRYQLYFDEPTYQLFQKGLDEVRKNNKKEVLRIMTIVIAKSKEKLNNSMPLSINPYYYRANANSYLGNYIVCISDCDMVLTDTLRNEELRLWKANSLRQIGQTDKAMNECKRVLGFCKNKPGVYLEMAFIYAGYKKYDSACFNLKTAQRLGYSIETIKKIGYCDSLESDKNSN